MKRILLPLLCGLCCGLPAAAQEYGRTKLSSEYRDDKSVVISADKEYPGIQTVVIQFSRLENCDNVSPTERVEVRQSGPLLTLRPTNDRQYVRYSYSYQVYDHAVDPKVDREFLYRLPFSADRRAKAARTASDTRLLQGRDKKDEPIRMLGYRFELSPGDTIYAARKGRVIEVRLPENTEKRSGLAYTRDQSKILVEHADGTVARYGSVEDIRVEAGEMVYPFTPLGLASSFDGKRYFLNFSVCYRSSENSTEEHRFPLVYFTPRFATASGDTELVAGEGYAPRVDNALLTREMNKRERKKFGIGK